MKPVLIFRHLEHEGPGYFQDFLQQKEIPFKLVRVDAGDTIYGDIKNTSGLVFMGGNMSVNDPLPWIRSEITLIQKAIDHDIQVLGHCLGAQLIARALGAEVKANHVTEIGWHQTRIVDNLVSRQWFTDLPAELELYHWHSETFAIPDGAERIMESENCVNQGFVYDKSLALQCHIEMTEEMVRDWASRGGDDLILTDSVQGVSQMLDRLPERIAVLNRIADRIYSHWIKDLKDS
jgi:GMP synthase-like glutamine amidotransferase